MSRREMAADVLDDEQRRDLAAWERAVHGGDSEATGLPRANSDGYDQRGDFHGIPGHWDWGRDE